MWSKIYLTKFDRQELDPYGHNARTIARFRSATKWIPNPPSQYIRPGLFEKVQEVQAKLMKSQGERHREYWSYNQELLPKVGPQGGVFPLNILLDSLKESYENAEGAKSFEQVLVGVNFLTRIIKQLIAHVGMPVPKPVVFYNTNAAIPTGLKKGTFRAETEGFSALWKHLYPDLPGERAQRQKLRCIHQDSVVNVRSIEGILGGVREWLRTYLPEYFGAWLNPDRYTRPSFTRCVDRGFISVELDYTAMDAHFSQEIVEKVLYPIYELLLTPGEFLRFQVYVNECFKQPVFLDTVLLTGVHSLFSGICPTNDFETIYSVALDLGGVLCSDLDERKVTFAVCGDDSTIILPKKTPPRIVDLLVNNIVDEAGKNGEVIHPEKRRISDKSIRFCRQVYYSAGRRNCEGVLLGAYPSVLTVNNIVHPEFVSKSAGLAALADLQRLDGIAGSPDFAQVCDLVFKYALHKFKFSQSDWESSPVDWWERVYGERWDPQSSQAMQYFLRSSLRDQFTATN